MIKTKEIPEFLRGLRGWRRLGAAGGLGAAMALSMPPFDLFPLLWVCLPALIFLLQGTQNNKQAFAVGWSFAFGFLTVSLYWIAASMLVDFNHFWWAIPLSVAGLPALFSLYYGIAALVARRIGMNGVAGALTCGLLWFTADYARGHLFTGFPWNILGYGWSGALPVLQITSVIGIYGLSLLTTIVAALPAAGKKPALIGIALFALVAGWGEYRLQTTQVGDVPAVRLRIVQPNIEQDQKWLVAKRDADFDELLNLTSQPGDVPVTHVVWPETASTYYLSEDAYRRQMIARHIPAAASVMTGVIRRDLDAEGNTRFYNSLVAVDGLGRLVAGYDKGHLVPFGEFMPLRKYVPIKALAASDADFTPGDGPRSLRVLGLPPFSPLICYEAIFPGAAVDEADRPDFIMNVTNDAWYGHTIGPYQHFAIARVRAIEEGLPLIRAANTGISAIIDPIGRIRVLLSLGKQGVIDGNLPTPLFLTPYTKMGDTPVGVVYFAWFVFVLARFVLRCVKGSA